MTPASFSGPCPDLEQHYRDLEGEVPAADSQRLRAHARTCPHCAALRAEAEELRRMEAEVRAIPRASPDESRELSRVRRTQAREATSRAAADASPGGLVAPVLRDFTVERHLASGGCADVWLARTAAGRVALKCVRPELDAHELAALEQYKRIAAPDPGLLPIEHLTRCETTGRLCYTMPLADPLYARDVGIEHYVPATLENVAAMRGGLPLDEVLELADALLGTLARLHERGLVHRDVKPENVLRYGGRWVLGDTGLLVREGEAPRTVGVGTPRFYPAGRPNDVRAADVVAAARTLYVALNGDLERFPAPTATQVRTGTARRRHMAFLRALARASEHGDAGRIASAEGLRLALRERPGAGVRGLVAGIAIALLAAAWFATRERSGADAVLAAESAPRVATLELLLRNPGDEVSRYLRPSTPLRAGVELVPVGLDPRVRHGALVLAQYVRGQRSVHVYAPISDPGPAGRWTFAHGLGADGAPRSFLLRQPGPLLCLLVGSDEPLDAGELERTVEAVLDERPGWPAEAAASTEPAADAPLRLRGASVVPLAEGEPQRGGPEPEVGRALPSPDAVTLARRLAERLGPFEGILAEVTP